MSVKPWRVDLRSDQLDCLIACCEYLISRHSKEINKTAVIDIEEFAHRQSRDRIMESLSVLKDIGHKP